VIDSAVAPPALRGTTPSGRPGVRWWRRRVAWLAFACMCAAGVAFLMWRGRGNTFFWDEWGWIEFRRSGLHAVLGSYNQHVEPVPLAVYQLLLSTVGLAHYWVFRLLATLAHLACATAVFVFARRRIGTAALLPAAVVVFLGSGWEFILWGVNFGFTASIALGISALIALDIGGRRAELIACGLLIVGLMFSEFAALFSLGIAAELGWRDRSLRRAWVWAVPLALYAVWWLGYYEPSTGHVDLAAVPKFIVNMASSAAGGLFGANIYVGRVVLVLFVALLGWRIARRAALTPRLLALSVTLGSFWLLVALGRAQFGQPWLSRYIYTGAVLMVLIMVESVRGARPNRATVAAVAVLAVLALVGNLRAFNGGESYLGGGSRMVAGELSALQLARATAPPSLVLDPHYAPQIIAGPYFTAIRAIGSSPADTPRQLLQAPENVRAAADTVLWRADQIQISPIPETARHTLVGQPPAVQRILAGTTAESSSCVVLRPGGNGAGADLLLPPGGLEIHSQVGSVLQLRVRRFAANFHPLPPVDLVNDEAITIHATGDSRTPPWQLQIASTQPFQACALA
jgi:hypothetical protein